MDTQTLSCAPLTTRGELFALQLRLHPQERGLVLANAGPHLQAAFLDLVRQIDPALSDALHTPDRRRPYTLGMLQGFNHLRPEQLAQALDRGDLLPVHPGQVYWLRITTLDATLFDIFVKALLLRARSLVLRIGQVNFEVSRLITTPEEEEQEQRQTASSSFHTLFSLEEARPVYRFAFTTPTVFSLGKTPWGKRLHLFPEPSHVFKSIADQWENFAPLELRLATHQLTPLDISSWCAENVIVSHYNLITTALHAPKFGQMGFQGTVRYEVKGSRNASEAQWLSIFARFAFFSGVGYKTAMGMGQTRCLSLALPHPPVAPQQKGQMQ